MTPLPTRAKVNVLFDVNRKSDSQNCFYNIDSMFAKNKSNNVPEREDDTFGCLA